MQYTLSTVVFMKIRENVGMELVVLQFPFLLIFFVSQNVFGSWSFLVFSLIGVERGLRTTRDVATPQPEIMNST